MRMRYLVSLLPKLIDLNVHVVYNVRDPRAIISSRKIVTQFQK